MIDAIEASVALELEANDVHLHLEVDPDLQVESDPQLLASAIGNLMQNAVKFTRPGGAIIVRAFRAGDHVRIEVEDECGGLPAGRAESLFAPFIQGQAAPRGNGLGLGLAIARESVEASGGQIGVTNLPGKGCRFVIEMPAHERPSDQPP